MHIHKQPFAPDLPNGAVAAMAPALDTADTQSTKPVPLRIERDTAFVAHGDVSGLLVPAGRGTEAMAAAAAAQSVAQPTPSVTFLRESKGKLFWRKTWVRVGLALTGWGLMVTLSVQVLVHQRDRIAATMPAAKPAIAGLCWILNCRISPLRQIESIVIDGSTFTELRGNAYRLGFTIRNTAPVELAMPSLELTLTDSQDRAALRRVFLPSEMGPAPTQLGASGEWTGTLVVSVRMTGSSEPITGYRISALYP